jgi:molybdenum cofactor sulfurtransferase
MLEKLEFIKRSKEYYGYPGSKKGFIDDWRSREFPTLLPPITAKKQQQLNRVRLQSTVEPEVYLDYAGSALPTRSQLSRIYEQCIMIPNMYASDTANSTLQTDVLAEEIYTQILANPHSLGGGVASDRTWKLMQKSIHRVMSHFGIGDEQIDLCDSDAAENGEHNQISPGYRLVFTSGATESLRIVAERFPWSCFSISSPRHHEIVMTSNSSSDQRHRALDGQTTPNEIEKMQVKSVKVQSMLVYPRNSHTSVIGMRNVALSRGAKFQCVPTDELQTASTAWFKQLTEKCVEYDGHNTLKSDEKKRIKGISNETLWVHNLLVLPVECNFGGDRFDWSSTVAAARTETCMTHFLLADNSTHVPNAIQVCHKWHVLLDSAKAAATSEVNLSTILPSGPDFAICSFYKLFGHPTGLGALFIKKHYRQREMTRRHAVKQDRTAGGQDLEFMLDGQHKTKHYFGGGSVDVVLPNLDFTVLRGNQKPPSRVDILIESTCGTEELIEFSALSSGTQHFRGIIELMHGFQEIDELGGMSKVC